MNVALKTRPVEVSDEEVPATPTPTIERTGPHVYAAIADITSALAKDGIGKNRQATGGGANYAFRGIDDVYNALAVLLGKYRLVIIPRVLSRTVTERTSKGGACLTFTILDMEFDLISALDGSKHTARTLGEAMDAGDKSTNKSMSAAYKYMAFQTFCIPLEGNDSESDTHELEAPKSALEKAVAHLRTCSVDKGSFRTAWEFNKNPWKGILDSSDYQILVSEMKTIAATFVDDEAPAATQEYKPAPPRPEVPRRETVLTDKPIGDDDIPEAFR
jgi:hypothetical protein